MWEPVIDRDKFFCTHYENIELFHDGGHYHIETSPLICSAYQWAGFYMIGTSFIKELKTLRWNLQST